MTGAPALQDAALRLIDRINARTARVGVIGMGYVGLPLALSLARAGFPVIGMDTDPPKVTALNAGRSYLTHIPSSAVADARDAGRFQATGDPAAIGGIDVIILCVPTPLTRHREPDLQAITSTAESIRPHLRPGQLVTLESTTYPGTTSEVLTPILERDGLKAGRDFFVAYAPEREDPGAGRPIAPKVVGAAGAEARRLAEALYETLGPVVPVSTPETAEAVKLTENIFRAVNIALVNELKLVFEAMGVDVWEVIEAASTKPFGYMPFHPGPGLGGHCIPIDPFYLTWKAREFDIATRFIELAGEVNAAMPAHVVERLARALDERAGRGLKGARILLLGVAYKKNVGDTRESPALRLSALLTARGAAPSFYDPHVPVLPALRHYPALSHSRTLPWSAVERDAFDAAILVTDHDALDYPALARLLPLIVDTRNAFRRAGIDAEHIVRA